MAQQMSVHDEQAVQMWRRETRLDPDPLRRFRYALYHEHESLEEALRRLPAGARDSLGQTVCLEPLRVVVRQDSELDQSSKLLLEAVDGERVEAVLLRARSGRAAVCISTQVGCRAGCSFCATARMGLRRSLTVGEIVEQVLVAAREFRRERTRLRNVVFMGMGEPLDNEPALHAALRILAADDGCRIPLRRLSVSTVGVPDAMVRLVDRFPGVQLALSLHSARPEIRERLVPWARRHSLAEIRAALVEVAGRERRHRHQGLVMIEHILIDGVNDGPEDAQALLEFLRGLPVHVNLIPFNPVAHAPHWGPTPRERRDTFAAPLRAAGVFTTIRYSLGADVAAACGQLALPARS